MRVNDAMRGRWAQEAAQYPPTPQPKRPGANLRTHNDRAIASDYGIVREVSRQPRGGAEVTSTIDYFLLANVLRARGEA